MTDADIQAVAGDNAISPRLRQYIKRHDEKLREELGAKIDGLFAQMAERADERIAAAVAKAQQGPGASAAIERLREDVRLLAEGVRVLGQRIDRLATSADLRFKSVLGHIGDQARAAGAAPVRARDDQGRLVDPLLTAVETRRRLLGMTQRRLAEILQVRTPALSKWISGHRAASSHDTRNLMQQWLDATDAEAKVALDRLMDWK